MVHGGNLNSCLKLLSIKENITEDRVLKITYEPENFTKMGDEENRRFRIRFLVKVLKNSRYINGKQKYVDTIGRPQLTCGIKTRET